MTNTDLPVRGDLERIIRICGDIDTTPTSRETVTEAYDLTPGTTNNDVLSALRLGLMGEAEDGVFATDLGIDLATTAPDTEQRNAVVREAIAEHDDYTELLDTVFRNGADDTVTHDEVDRVIRLRLADIGKDSRSRAVSRFFKFIGAAGVGNHVSSYGENPERLEITDHDALDALLDRIDGTTAGNENGTDSDTTSDAAAPDESTESENDTTVEPVDPGMESQWSSAQTLDTPTASPPAGPEISATSTERRSQPAVFDIALELDGTEDPAHIERLVAAVRRGLQADHDSASNTGTAESSAATNHLPPSERPVVADGDDPELHEGEQPSSNTPWTTSD